MSVYSRYKRSPEGFRALVELLETTPVTRRQKMLEVGMLEDPEYTALAMQYMMTWEDVLGLPDVELAEVLAVAPSRMVAFALKGVSDEVKTRFIRNSKAQIGAEIRDFMQMEIGLREVGGAQMKMISTARELERKGLVRTKVIPVIMK